MQRSAMLAARSRLCRTGITSATSFCHRSWATTRKRNNSLRRVQTPNPVDLLFADMDKLSPGDDSLSLYVLRSLPQHRFEVVVDAGCGAGRQTMVLASALTTPIQA